MGTYIASEFPRVAEAVITLYEHREELIKLAVEKVNPTSRLRKEELTPPNSGEPYGNQNVIEEYVHFLKSCGFGDGSVVVRCCHTRSRAHVRILGRLMVLFIPDSHLSEIRIMAVTTERKDGSG